MSTGYQLTSGSSVIRLVDGASIPNSPTNIDWQEYQAWLALGHTPVPVEVPVASLQQLAVQAMYAGYQITLSGSIVLAATLFPVDPVTQQELMAVMETISQTGAFANGATSFQMEDSQKNWHTFNVSQYKAVAIAIDNYVTTLTLIYSGNPSAPASLPSNSITLAV